MPAPLKPTPGLSGPPVPQMLSVSGFLTLHQISALAGKVGIEKMEDLFLRIFDRLQIKA